MQTYHVCQKYQSTQNVRVNTSSVMRYMLGLSVSPTRWWVTLPALRWPRSWNAQVTTSRTKASLPDFTALCRPRLIRLICVICDASRHTLEPMHALPCELTRQDAIQWYGPCHHEGSYLFAPCFWTDAEKNLRKNRTLKIDTQGPSGV
jgi:hypothetical protein